MRYDALVCDIRAARLGDGWAKLLDETGECRDGRRARTVRRRAEGDVTLAIAEVIAAAWAPVRLRVARLVWLLVDNTGIIATAALKGLELLDA